MPLIAAAMVFLAVFVSAVGIYWRVRRERPPSVEAPQLPGYRSSGMVMYCPRCGMRNPAGSSLCGCGFSLSAINMAEPVLPPPFDAPVAKPPRPRRSVRNSWWPHIEGEESARAAAKQGMWAAFFCAGVTAAFSFLAGAGISFIQGVGPTAWVDAAVFAFLGLGIRGMSRLAAVGALALYVVERVAMAHTTGFNPMMFLVFVMCFIHGIRGTFAFHRYREWASAPRGGVTPLLHD